MEAGEELIDGDFRVREEGEGGIQGRSPNRTTWCYVRGLGCRRKTNMARAAEYPT
jgi:hypothetical protein